ncbi:hypothetical protein K435DRAFT_145840 [Dendrothele bispora CBS 962.96]|uniref:Uncharacterized protein n=1 Tax=Dendrothele bispora (strain CBS 962.96) TaxID=1314807 RepID=A0A4S8MR78_DENBC|nr:hypothetical protein K435DRAFT_145840 [Dendrothele bispora CBS 962.96]
MGLLERIQQSTPPNDRLTNPEVSSHLVYPVLSAHTGDCQDFLPWSSISEDEDQTVKFRGRKLVQRIVEMLLKLYGRPGCPHCRLFGTFGAGLTYLMLAAVNSLLAAGYPVVWIPIQSGRIRPAFIRNALLLALAARRTTDSETFTDLFHRCNDDPRDLFRFTNHLADKKIRLIFVYLNFDKATKDDAQFYFNLASGHVFCMTGNPNSTFCKEGELKPWTIEVFHLKGGLQDVSLTFFHVFVWKLVIIFTLGRKKWVVVPV